MRPGHFGVHQVVDLHAELVGHDKKVADQLVVVPRIAVLGAEEQPLHGFRVDAIRILVEGGVPLEELHILSSPIFCQPQVEPSAHLVEKLTLPNVFLGHGVLPAIKDGLELSVEVSQQDEPDAHHFPLGHLHQHVELHLGDLVYDHDAAWTGGTTLLLVFAEVMHERLASDEHGGAMAQCRDDLLVFGAELPELLQDLVDEESLANSRRSSQEEASVLDEEVDQVVDQVVQLLLSELGPDRLVDDRLLHSQRFRLVPRGHFGDWLRLDLEDSLAVWKAVDVQNALLNRLPFQARVCEVDSVNHGPNNFNFGTSKRSHCLADPHLFDLQCNASPRGHAIEADELGAGEELEDSIAEILLAARVAPGVGLVRAGDCLPGVLLRGVP